MTSGKVADMVETFPKTANEEEDSNRDENFTKAGLVRGGAVRIGRTGFVVSLPHLLSDHAVLQREAPIHIWGSFRSG